MRRHFALAGLLLVGCECDQREAEAPIARCAEADGDVRSHPAASTTWDPLAVGAMLEAGAWIQTAEASWARIQFLSGSELRIDPSSVVVLDAPDEEEEGGLVSLKSGTVRGAVAKAAPGRRIVVKTAKGEKMRIDAAEGDVAYRVKVAPQGGVELAVTSGRAKIVSEDGTEVSLARGEVVRAASGGKLVGAVAKLPDRPVPNQAVQEEDRVRLTWPAAERAAKYRVQVRSGGRTIVDEVVTEREIVVTHGPGVLEWTVTAIDEAGRESEPSEERTTEVREVVPDRLGGPAKDAVIRFSGGRPAVTFKWDGGAGMLIVARDPEMRDVAFSGPGTGEIRTRALEAGTYWWIVRDEQDRAFAPRPRKLVLQKSRRGIKLPSKLKWR